MVGVPSPNQLATMRERNRVNAARERERPEYREYMREYFRTHKYKHAPLTPDQNRQRKLAHRWIA